MREVHIYFDYTYSETNGTLKIRQIQSFAFCVTNEHRTVSEWGVVTSIDTSPLTHDELTRSDCICLLYNWRFMVTRWSQETHRREYSKQERVCVSAKDNERDNLITRERERVSREWS